MANLSCFRNCVPAVAFVVFQGHFTGPRSLAVRDLVAMLAISCSSTPASIFGNELTAFRRQRWLIADVLLDTGGLVYRPQWPFGCSGDAGAGAVSIASP
jgi:hypothetical protein